MKLKTLILATAAAGSLIASTASMAGFMLKDQSKVVPASNIKVSCNGGAHVPGIFDTNLNWGVVNALFLKGTSQGTCTFYNGSAEIGSGYINIYDNTSGKVSQVKVIDPKLTISISPAEGTQAKDIQVILKDNK